MLVEHFGRVRQGSGSFLKHEAPGRQLAEGLECCQVRLGARGKAGARVCRSALSCDFDVQLLDQPSVFLEVLANTDGERVGRATDRLLRRLHEVRSDRSIG